MEKNGIVMKQIEHIRKEWKEEKLIREGKRRIRKSGWKRRKR